MREIKATKAFEIERYQELLTKLSEEGYTLSQISPTGVRIRSNGGDYGEIVQEKCLLIYPLPPHWPQGHKLIHSRLAEIARQF